MYRTLSKILVGMALALGLTVGFVAPAGSAQAAPTPAAAAADCSAEKSALDAAKSKRAATQQKLKQARVAKARAVKALKRAKATGNRAQVGKLTQRVKMLKRKVTRLQRELRNRTNAVRAAQGVYDECAAGGGGLTPESPIQDLCDAGLPQALCDALGGLPGVGGTGSPLDALCHAAPLPVPLPLCDGSGLPDGGLPIPADPAALLDLFGGLPGLSDLLGGGLPELPGLPGLPQVPALP